MKWTDQLTKELRSLCFDNVPNKEIAEYFGVPVSQIHAKRSQLGITIPKVKAAQGKPGMTIDPEFEAAVQQAEKEQKPTSSADLPNNPSGPCRGLEIFHNAGDTCIVLARSGDAVVIVRPSNGCAPFVVPLQHKQGAKDWWQGHYFGNLADAWRYYLEAIS